MKDENRNIIINSLLIIYLLLYQQIILKQYLKISEILTATIMITVMLIAFHVYQLKKEHKVEIKSNIARRLIIIIILYFIVNYSLGLLFGFQKNAYSMKPVKIIVNMIMPVLIIITEEVYRAIMITSTNRKVDMIITTITLILFEIFISIRVQALFSIASAFKILTTIVIPIISKNIVFSYLVRKVGIKVNLFYRLTIDTYIYFLPIIPNFSDYMKSMIGLCFPIIIYFIASNMLEDYNKQEENYNPDNRMKKIIQVPIALIMIGFIALISDFFPLTIVGIASSSMSPIIEKGDAVIIKRIEEAKELKVRDIIAYRNKNNQIIVHRIVEINKTKNKVIIRTKGDANNKVDNQKVKLKDIKGVVKLKLKYIGLPSVYFNELKK